MYLGRLTFRDALSRYLRGRTAGLRDLVGAAVDATPPLRPDHGGVTATTGTETTSRDDEDSASRRRRKAAYTAVAQFLKLPRGTDIDIEVVEENDAVTFLIRDARTGALLRTLSENQAQRVVDLLRPTNGSLVDRSF